MARAQIWLGDLVVAIEDLEIRDPERLARAADMLGIEAREARSTHLPAASGRAEEPRLDERRGNETSTPAAESPQTSPFESRIRNASLRLLTTGSSSTTPPAAYATVAPLARPVGPTPRAKSAPPIFPQRKSRALLTTAVSTWAKNGVLDVPRAVETFARLRSFRELPEIVAPTLLRGVQLLIDTSIGMAPFRLDVEHIKKEIEKIVPTQLVRTLYFIGCPTRGCVAENGVEERAWRPPPRGTPAFLVTDLGIGGPLLSEERALPHEWEDFLAAAREAGCELAALVPYPAERWPGALAHRLRIVHWHAATSVATVRRGAPRPREHS